MMLNRRAFAASSGLSTHQTAVIRGDRDGTLWLSVRPPPPGGGRGRGFWLEQAHAD